MSIWHYFSPSYVFTKIIFRGIAGVTRVADVRRPIYCSHSHIVTFSAKIVAYYLKDNLKDIEIDLQAFTVIKKLKIDKEIFEK